MMGAGGPGGAPKPSLCGDGTCEGPETIDNCKIDCDPTRGNIQEKSAGLIGKIINFLKRLLNQTSTKPAQNQPGQERICGNDLCEPSLGESKQNCPKDCSAGD